MVRVARVAREYVGKGRYEEQGQKLIALLHLQKQAFDKALGNT